MPEQFSVEDLTNLNDLRRRIAADGVYTDEEVAKAISLFTVKREEALAEAKPKPKTKSKVIAIDLDDL